MAGIELVIKIPEEDYERCKKRFLMRLNIMGDAIANGTPLPKGHGRLVDESKITKCEQVGLIITDENVTRCLATDAPTIIEADDAESEDKE